MHSGPDRAIRTTDSQTSCEDLQVTVCVLCSTTCCAVPHAGLRGCQAKGRDAMSSVA